MMFMGFQEYDPDDAERRQSLEQLHAWSLVFFQSGNMHTLLSFLWDISEQRHVQAKHLSSSKLAHFHSYFDTDSKPSV